jgi:hypothetical protein
LGYLGGCAAESPFIEISRLMTFLYFFMFLILMPFVVALENFSYDLVKFKK